MHKILKLICLSILLLGSGLQAIKPFEQPQDRSQPDKIELGKQLVRAAQNENWNDVERLINQGVDLNQRDQYNRTALIIATLSNRSKIAEMLINAHADLNLKDNYGQTALAITIDHNRPEIAQILINAKVDLNQKDLFGGTPLMRATSRNRPEIAQMLINAHADLNQKVFLGGHEKTALMIAAEDNHTEIARMLIDAMLEAPINPSNAPLTTEQKDLLRVAGLSLLRAYPSQIPKDIRRLILQDVAATFRRQNFIREQINRISDEDEKKFWLEYFESKIRSEEAQKNENQ